MRAPPFPKTAHSKDRRLQNRRLLLSSRRLNEDFFIFQRPTNLIVSFRQNEVNYRTMGIVGFVKFIVLKVRKAM